LSVSAALSVTALQSVRIHVFLLSRFLFFFTYPPTTDIYTLSLHDALPISSELDPGATFAAHQVHNGFRIDRLQGGGAGVVESARDRKSTRLNSSHGSISYAVFCLKKKKKKTTKNKQQKKSQRTASYTINTR